MQGYLTSNSQLVLELVFITILLTHIDNSLKKIRNKDFQTQRKIKTFE